MKQFRKVFQYRKKYNKKRKKGISLSIAPSLSKPFRYDWPYQFRLADGSFYTYSFQDHFPFMTICHYEGKEISTGVYQHTFTPFSERTSS